jgi:hypothetical protein
MGVAVCSNRPLFGRDAPSNQARRPLFVRCRRQAAAAARGQALTSQRPRPGRRRRSQDGALRMVPLYVNLRRGCEDPLYCLKAGPAGGRLRRPSSRRQRRDGHGGTASPSHVALPQRSAQHAMDQTRLNLETCQESMRKGRTPRGPPLPYRVNSYPNITMGAGTRVTLTQLLS